MSIIKFFIALSFIALSALNKDFNNPTNDVRSKMERDTCVVDISINNLTIDDSSSIGKALGNIRNANKYKWTLSDDDEGIFLLNYSGTKYLKMEQTLSAGGKAFDFFEVGYKNERKNPKIIYNKSQYPDFITESGIKLGISKDRFFKIKGHKLKLKKGKDEMFYKNINDFDNCAYNKKLGESTFELWWIFRKGVLIKFGFGYQNP
jgi:hypothetical protein